MNPATNLEFSSADRETLWRIIFARRDIRHFTSRPVPDAVLARILRAAHHAPSVGFSQPWRFLVIRSLELREKIKQSFIAINATEQDRIDDPQRRSLYKSLKLEGILEAPFNLAVACDLRDADQFVLGRGPMPATAYFSVCCAIQNLWLAARAEGVGVGWVSIVDPIQVANLLELPEGVSLVAYLCVGYPHEFPDRPVLDKVGWAARADLESLVFSDIWGQPVAPETQF